MKRTTIYREDLGNITRKMPAILLRARIVWEMLVMAIAFILLGGPLSSSFKDTYACLVREQVEELLAIYTWEHPHDKK